MLRHHTMKQPAILALLTKGQEESHPPFLIS